MSHFLSLSLSFLIPQNMPEDLSKDEARECRREQALCGMEGVLHSPQLRGPLALQVRRCSCCPDGVGGGA